MAPLFDIHLVIQKGEYHRSIQLLEQELVPLWYINWGLQKEFILEAHKAAIISDFMVCNLGVFWAKYLTCNGHQIWTFTCILCCFVMFKWVYFQKY